MIRLSTVFEAFVRWSTAVSHRCANACTSASYVPVALLRTEATTRSSSACASYHSGASRARSADGGGFSFSTPAASAALTRFFSAVASRASAISTVRRRSTGNLASHSRLDLRAMRVMKSNHDVQLMLCARDRYGLKKAKTCVHERSRVAWVVEDGGRAAYASAVESARRVLLRGATRKPARRGADLLETLAVVQPDPVGVPNAVRDSTGGTVLAEAHARETRMSGGWERGERTRAWGNHQQVHVRVHRAGGRRGRNKATHPPDVHGVHDELESGQVHRLKVGLPVGEDEVVESRERGLALLASAHRVAAEHHRFDARQEIEHKRVDRQLAAFERHALENDAMPARDHVEPLNFEPRFSLAVVLARRRECAVATHRSRRAVSRRLRRSRWTRRASRFLAPLHHRVERIVGVEEVILAAVAGSER